MKYILLAAGRGTRLSPLTLSNAKALFKLDRDTTLIGRTISLINKYDSNANIIVVVGYKHKQLEEILDNVEIVYNPFYEVTNSIGSLWLAKEHLIESDHIVIVNADVFLSEQLMQEVVCKPVKRPTVLVDGSIKSNGDYNVEISEDRVLVMSKELREYFGEYAGVTLLEKNGARTLFDAICEMVENGEYDQWYENALVRAIFMDDFKLYYQDIREYNWTEIDDINDVAFAKKMFRIS